jgi:putative toxin-antitoxin system antitoxin component (TIGR02293 family)
MGVIAIDKKSGAVLAKYKKSFANDISVLSNARKGLKAQAVFDFMTLSGLSLPLVEKVFTKSIKTFNNYKEKNTLFDPTLSEKLLRLFALYDKGADVFGSVEVFNQWMAVPAYGLGGEVPQQLLDTITGIQMITDELSRIEHGVLA